VAKLRAEVSGTQELVSDNAEDFKLGGRGQHNPGPPVKLQSTTGELKVDWAKPVGLAGQLRYVY
jgi:hypothetical protein